MTLKEMMVVILADQDQAIEDAKRWCTKNGGETYNPQMMTVWEYCTKEEENPMLEVLQGFALIGLRHVMQQIEDNKNETAAQG